jgi:hypothetical protein
MIEAIFDAVSRPNVRTIAIKTVGQQDTQLIHRLRQDAIKRRTALVNKRECRFLGFCVVVFLVSAVRRHCYIGAGFPIG